MPSRPAENAVSLNTVVDVLKRRKGTVLAGMILATAAAALYALTQPDQYRAEVLMSVEPAAAQDYLKPADAPLPINIQEKLWLIRENVYKPSILQTVIDEFHLDQNPQPSSRHWWTDALRDAKTATASIVKIFRPQSAQPSEQQKHEELLERVKSRIKIQVEAADAFSIGFEGSDRVQAADAANRLAELLVEHTARASEQRAGSAAGFLESEVNRVKATLDQQKEQIQNYQRTATDQLPAQLATNLKMLETLEGQLLAKKDQIADEQARRAATVEEMTELSNQGILDAPGEPSPAAAKLADLKARLKELQTKYTPQHPEVKATEAQIRDLEKTAAAAPVKDTGDPSPARLRYMQLKAEQEAIDRRLASYQQQEQALVPQIEDYRRKVQAAPERERTLADLTHDYEDTRTQYQSLLDKQNRAQLEERLEQTTQSTMFRVVRPAQFPLEPFEPKRGRIVLLGLFGGLGLGLMIAIFAEYRDTTYRTVEDFRGSMNLPVLAVIPAIAATGNEPGTRVNAKFSLKAPSPPYPRQAVTLADPRSISAEQYGYLAMQVRHLLGEHSSHVAAVTSAAGGEGKTLTSVNLAVMLSRTAPGRVLLVDCDLRKPRVHEYLGVSASCGISDLLVKADRLPESCFQHVQHLAILPSGPTLSNPLEVLSSDRTRSLFETLRGEFQYIVVDLPPILPIADSQVIAEFCDGVMLVVRAGMTRRELLQHALERFNVPNLLGVVLNGVELERSTYARAYDYYAQEYASESPKRMATRR